MIAESITEPAFNLSNQIKIKIHSFEYISIACGECTIISITAQLAVYFRACDIESNIFKELLGIILILLQERVYLFLFVNP